MEARAGLRLRPLACFCKTAPSQSVAGALGEPPAAAEKSGRGRAQVARAGFVAYSCATTDGRRKRALCSAADPEAGFAREA
jgi:hypothetical protein